MADNVAITAGTGTSVATDDVSGVHYQYVKLADGTADASTKIAAGNGTNGGALRVTVASDSTGVVGLAAGTNTIGNVGLVPRTTGGLSIFRSIDLDESEEEIKATAGQVYGMWVTNTATSTRFVKFYNATAASVTVGTTTPVITIGIPGNSSDDVTGLFGSGIGIAFDTAITVAATTAVADTDTGAPSANDVIINVFYT